MIKIKRGLDLPITGLPEQTIDDGNLVSQVAVLDMNKAVHLHVKVNSLIPAQASTVGADRFDRQVLHISRHSGSAVLAM